MSNKYASYCVDCRGNVGPGHGNLKKTNGKWVVSCGRKKQQALQYSKSTSHKAAKRPLLNSAVPQTASDKTLSNEQAAEMLSKIGSEFVRPVPTSEPELSIGYEITIDGKTLSVEKCGKYVGQATDWDAERSHVISLFDGSVLETVEKQGNSLDWMHAPLHKWERELGVPISMERSGKSSVSVGQTMRLKDGHWYMVVRVSKPYYMSAEDAEDMDMFDRGGGWATPFQVREITEPRAERDKRETKESADDEAALRLIEQIKAAREQVCKLFPLGIRSTVEAEDKTYSAWSDEPVVLTRPDTSKLSPGVAERLKVEFGDTMYDRLPPMPGNEHGCRGWREIRLVNGRHIVMHCDDSYDGAGWICQGIEIKPEDTEILEDQKRREAIQAYVFDKRLYELLVELDSDGLASEYGRHSFFGGTPFVAKDHPPCSQGAYGGNCNRTAEERRQSLLKHLASVDDLRAREAVEILQSEQAIMEWTS